MQHPLDKLTVRDGKLIHQQDAALPGKEYLATPPIAIKGKKTVEESATQNLVSYTFELSDRVDSVWSNIFTQYVEDTSARASGSELVIRCIPANLKSRYAKAKKAIEDANREYAGVKQQVLNQVGDLNAKRQTDKRASEERTKAIQDQFNELEL